MIAGDGTVFIDGTYYYGYVYYDGLEFRMIKKDILPLIKGHYHRSSTFVHIADKDDFERVRDYVDVYNYLFGNKEAFDLMNEPAIFYNNQFYSNHE